MKQVSYFQDFWRALSTNRGAVAGLIVIAVFLCVALLAPWVAPHSPDQIFSDALQKAPSWGSHILGTDDLGRDQLTRLVYGARVSLAIGFCVVAFSLLIGTVVGLVAGYFGGTIDTIVMRVNDILMTLPSILLAIVVVSILGPSLMNTIIAVSFVTIPKFIRLVRATVLAEKQKPYVTASKCFGASHFRQMFVNILPNCTAPILVQATLGFSDGILDAAALGFLGLGAQPPIPEWGTMLADSRAFIESNPWLVTLPGLCILTVVLSFNLFGDGLRDALDPKLRR